MGLACRNRQNCVTSQLFAALQHDADVAGQQTISEDAMTPGKLIAAPLDIRDERQIVVDHGSEARGNSRFGNDHVCDASTTCRARHRSSQAFCF